MGNDEDSVSWVSMMKVMNAVAVMEVTKGVVVVRNAVALRG